MRRRIVVLLAACGITLASAQYPPADPDRIPSVTDPSVPLTYVGNNGSISIGVNAEGETEGQLMGVFARNDARALIGQLWWDRAGAGGVQFDFNWLWGGDPIAARQHPDQATVSRLSFALDQNAQHARKATLGFGIERRAFSAEAWLAHGVSGARSAGRSLQDEVVRTTGRDELGDYTMVETTTIDTLFESKPFGTEVGLQFSHVFEPWATRVYGAGSTQEGDGVRATTLSLGLDTPLGTRGWGLAARADHVQRSGMDGGDDNRLAVFLRYEFGRHGAFVPTAQLDSPAWIARSLARPSSAHSRTVETYRRVRTRNVSVTRGPRQYSNHFPLAQVDRAATSEGVAVSIDVLANDSDADTDALSVSAVTAPAHGQAAITAGGILYTPDPGYVGPDSFAYTVSDGRGGSAGGRVDVMVGARPNAAPIARSDSAVAPYQTAILIDVLANDSDPDADALSLLAVGVPAQGTATIVGNQIQYVPAAGFSGVDQFSYTVGDGHGGTMSANVSVSVAARPNRAPIALADRVNAVAGQPTAIAVLANDGDLDGDPLTITAVGAPGMGSAVLAGSAIVYTAPVGWVGSTSFSYTISDGRGGTASAQVTVNVMPSANQVPIAVDDQVTAALSGSVFPINVLANDSDPDGDPLTITAVGAPAVGTAVISGSQIVYSLGAVTVPPSSVSFSYTISDGRGGTATAVVTLNFTSGGNQPPVAVDDVATTSLAGSVTINVLANDSDPNGDPLTITAVGTPSMGTAAIVGNQIVFTANGNVTGIASFSYTISDGNGGTATANVSVTVTP